MPTTQIQIQSMACVMIFKNLDKIMPSARIQFINLIFNIQYALYNEAIVTRTHSKRRAAYETNNKKKKIAHKFLFYYDSMNSMNN